jgi:hypothetical protein
MRRAAITQAKTGFVIGWTPYENKRQNQRTEKIAEHSYHAHTLWASRSNQ